MMRIVNADIGERSTVTLATDPTTDYQVSHLRDAQTGCDSDQGMRMLYKILTLTLMYSINDQILLVVFSVGINNIN